MRRQGVCHVLWDSTPGRCGAQSALGAMKPDICGVVHWVNACLYFVFEASTCHIGKVLLVLKPIPYWTLEVLRKGVERMHVPACGWGRMQVSTDASPSPCNRIWKNIFQKL